jgi:hypothetical protein
MNCFISFICFLIFCFAALASNPTVKLAVSTSKFPSPKPTLKKSSAKPTIKNSVNPSLIPT